MMKFIANITTAAIVFTIPICWVQISEMVN